MSSQPCLIVAMKCIMLVTLNNGRSKAMGINTGIFASSQLLVKAIVQCKKMREKTTPFGLDS